MMRLRKNTKGFTIIEVLIVLAIAGLIMLIIFVAIPALQRNARNRQRYSDAALLVAAVNECLLNHNGRANSCKTPTDLQFDVSKFSQYTGIHYGMSGPPTIDEPNWLFNTGCNAGGDSAEISGSAKNFSVSFFLESATPPFHIVGRCMEG